MMLRRWVCALLLLASAMSGVDARAADAASPGLSGFAGGIAVRAWTPPAGADDLASAQAALQQMAPQPQPGGRPEFQAPAHQPVWFALDLAVEAQGRPQVLELTHPSIRSADLYLPQAGDAPLVVRSGRDVPMQIRAGARFPATLAVPPQAGARTVFLRLKGAVVLRGQFLLQARSEWERQSRWQLGAMSACFSIVVLAVSYALWCAWRFRSLPYALYALLGLSIGVTGMFISGYGETWLWPRLAELRGPIASTMACVSAGLALLLAERAFVIEVRAPRFSRLLRLMGVLCPLAGVLGLAFNVAVHQKISHGAAGIAIFLSLCSFWFAWRTENRAAVWLLLGFVPVSLGVGVTTLAVAGIVPFTPWVLMAMPLGSVFEVPFNLFGLRLLEQRRALVAQSQAALARLAGSKGGSHQAMRRHWTGPAEDPSRSAGAGLLMLLRFPGLAPGSPRLRALDAVNVETFLHAMMASAVRPGSHIGRQSFHEIVVRNPHPQSQAAVRSLLTALFAAALRSERYGIDARDAQLRIAYGRTDGASLSLDAALDCLGRALDAPGHADQRRIEVTLQKRGVVLR